MASRTAATYSTRRSIARLVSWIAVKGWAVIRSRGQLHAADAAALPAVETELLDALEQAFDVARVLTQEAALEHEGVARTAAVPDFAVTAEPLVGVDPDDRHPHGGALDLGDAEIGD